VKILEIIKYYQQYQKSTKLVT